jgi:hypothetical protein
MPNFFQVKSLGNVLDICLDVFDFSAGIILSLHYACAIVADGSFLVKRRTHCGSRWVV